MQFLPVVLLPTCPADKCSGNIVSLARLCRWRMERLWIGNKVLLPRRRGLVGGLTRARSGLDHGFGVLHGHGLVSGLCPWTWEDDTIHKICWQSSFNRHQYLEDQCASASVRYNLQLQRCMQRFCLWQVPESCDNEFKDFHKGTNYFRRTDLTNCKLILDPTFEEEMLMDSDTFDTFLPGMFWIHFICKLFSGHGFNMTYC